MKTIRNLSIYILFSILLCIPTACSKDDTPPPEEISENEEDEEQEEEMEGNENTFTLEGTLGTAEFIDASQVDDNYILVNDAASNRVYLMDKKAELLHEWPLNGERLGNDAFLLPNGQLLAMLEAEDPKIEFGGFGGKLQLLDKDGNATWSFEYSSDDYILHHDAEMLPNGNIIVIVWERRTLEEAQTAGSNLETDVFPEGIIEVDPTTDTIVWEWYAWDHLIQQHDDTKNNFGVVADNPQLINLNYVPNEEGDIMHANAIAYDDINDLIYLSANFFSEVWVIDHSTTREEATSHSGGTFNRGGDLVYRFGNPEAYDNPGGERLFYNNHFPNILKGEDEGKLLIFTNGNGFDQSTVYELLLPEILSLTPNANNEPTVTWSFTDPDLFSPKVSGAVPLPNGNRLITEGDFGVWEVTDAGEPVWKFSNPGFYWRAYHYTKDAPEILSLGL